MYIDRISVGPESSGRLQLPANILKSAFEQPAEKPAGKVHKQLQLLAIRIRQSGDNFDAEKFASRDNGRLFTEVDLERMMLCYGKFVRKFSDTLTPLLESGVLDPARVDLYSKLLTKAESRLREGQEFYALWKTSQRNTFQPEHKAA